MNNPDLSIQLCKTREELIAAQDAEMALIEGLGNNIQLPDCLLPDFFLHIAHY